MSTFNFCFYGEKIPTKLSVNHHEIPSVFCLLCSKIFLEAKNSLMNAINENVKTLEY